MSRNGSGTYTLPAGNPVTTGTVISSSWANTTLSDIASALTSSIAKDGQTTPTNNLPMGGYKLTGMGVGSASTDSITLGQSQNSGEIKLAGVSGADTITATASPTLTAYTTGQMFNFVSVGANTGAVTLNIDGLGAKAVTKLGATALVASDIPSGAVVQVYYDGTQFQLINLAAQSTNSINPLSTSLTSKIQPIGATVAANAMTITLNPTVLDFRSTTAGSGTVSTVVLSSAATLVISSGSTLGTSNGVASTIAVLAINNAGTIEVAAINLSGGVDLSETGLISTTAEGGLGGADSINVIYSTTARTNVAYRVVGIITSTQATAGSWATAPSLIQGIGGNVYKVIPLVSTVRLNTSNGYGSTNTCILRFTNTVVNQGSDITYSDSATNGATFTINSGGNYITSFAYQNAAANGVIGISLNSTQLTTSIQSITAADRLIMARQGNAAGNNVSNTTLSVTWGGYLPAGSIIRAHADTGGTLSASDASFTISRVS